MVVVKEVVVVVLSKMNGVMRELQQQVARKTSVASPTVFTQRPHTCSQRLPTLAHLLTLAQGNLPFFQLSTAWYARLPSRNPSP